MGEIHLQSDLRMMELFQGPITEGTESQETPQKSNLLDSNGRSLLWHAVCAGAPEKVEWLLKHDQASLSTADVYGITPLHVACRRGMQRWPRCFCLLVQNPNANTKAPGLTPSHYAVIFDQPECLRLLWEHGADVARPTRSEGESFRPIHLALAARYHECVQILYAAGIQEIGCARIISAGSRRRMIFALSSSSREFDSGRSGVRFRGEIKTREENRFDHRRPQHQGYT